MTALELVSRLKGVQQNGTGWKALCPAHEDNRPSLSVAQTDDGKVLLKCMAGCSIDAVCHSLGLTIRDLFPPRTRNGATRQIVATYDYHDREGRLLFQVVRFTPKDFRQRRPDPDKPGEWIWKMAGVERVLYRLPEVLAAMKAGQPIYIVEGEKDVAALVEHGFCATCNAGGASKWLDAYTKTLAGADVVIIPDRDEPGRKHAQLVASKLHGIANRVRVIELPDVDGKPVKDGHDFFAAGGGIGDLQALVDAAPDWKPPVKPRSTLRQEYGLEETPPVSQPETEYDYANRLAESLPPLVTCGKRWHAYRAGAWLEIERATFRPEAQNILPANIRTARREGALLDHLEGRFQKSPDALAGFYMRSENGDILLNAANGIVRVKSSGEITLESHTPDYLFTHKLAAKYIADADAPLFQRVLCEVLNDPLDQNLFQLCAGNFMLPDCRFETALVCYGEAGRGKSTLAEPIADSLGRALVPRLTMGQICDPKSYHVPKLQFSAVNLGTELDAIELGDSGTFKALVSGEPVEARPIYAAPFTMQTTCKLWFLANSLPRFKHGTAAELRRTRFLRFDYLPPVKDVTLKARLAGEREGVFRWMLAGLVELLNVPFIPLGGRHSKEVHERFKVSNDPIGSFVTSCCRLDPTAKASKDNLRDAYREFCEQHNLPPSMDTWFLKNLYERWPQLREARPRDDERRRVILGIEVKL